MATKALTLRHARGQDSPISHNTALTLKEIVRGKKLRLRISRQIVVALDDDQNRPISLKTLVTDAVVPCGCDKKTYAELLPTCNVCGGRGTVLNSDGFAYSSESTMHTIHIPPGTREGGDCVITMCGNMHPGYVPADMSCIISYKRDRAFKVVENDAGSYDLHTSIRIPLADALLGGGASIRHPDNRRLYINTPGVIVPGLVVRLAGGGLYVGGKRGDMLVTTNVDFPSDPRTVQEMAIDVLRRLSHSGAGRGMLPSYPMQGQQKRPQCAQQ